MRNHTYTRKAVAGATVLAAATALAALPFAPAASAGSLEQYIEVPNCNPPQPQLCTPIPSVDVQVDTAGEMRIDFIANANHCSDMIAHVKLDGREVGANRVGPGQDDGGHKVNVAAGKHTVAVQAEGIQGGCNHGGVSAWGGTLSIRTPDTPPQAAPPANNPACFTSDATNGGDIHGLKAHYDSCDATVRLEYDQSAFQPVEKDHWNIDFGQRPASDGNVPIFSGHWDRDGGKPPVVLFGTRPAPYRVLAFFRFQACQKSFLEPSHCASPSPPVTIDLGNNELTAR